MTDLRTPENMRPDEVVREDELVAADDAIIGRAFMWSLAVLAPVALAVGAMVWFLGRPKPVVVQPARALVLPKSVDVAVKPPRLKFTDITSGAGIDFVHENGATGDKLLPETMGGGCAFLDYDNDGDQDVLMVNSTWWPDHPKGDGPPPTMALYRNDGAGHFENVTKGSGLDVSFYGMGAAIGDYDNDGDADVFITAVGANHLFRNDAGHFKDVTEAAGVAGPEDAWGTSAGFVDIDNDGDLDLFVCRYVKWSRAIDFAVNYTLTGIGRAYGPPINFEGSNYALYRNNGDGTFADVSAAAGIQRLGVQGLPMAKALGLAPADIDRDGFIDLLVANDTVQRFFFHNKGDGAFEDKGPEYGLAFDRDGLATGAMGVDSAQYRNDPAIGFVIGNFANQMTSLMVSQADPRQFSDEAITEGIGAPTRLKLTFGAFFFDADLDGRPDLLHANGHIEDQINIVQPSQQYRQAAQLFWNAGPQAKACFAEVPAAETGDLATPIVGRGAAYADIDGDGDLDVLLTQAGGKPMLLRNDRESKNHWLRVKLAGKAGKSNRDAIGAVIELRAGGATQTRQVMPTRSYLSQVELPVTFGLGTNDQIESLKIRWPDGSRQEIERPRADQLLVVAQD